MSHYDTLGIPDNASLADIKRAYRQLCSEHHPDKGGDVEKMAAVNDAYAVLSDPVKKRAYDEFGNPEADIEKIALGNVEHMIVDLMRNGFEGRDWAEALREISREAVTGLESAKQSAARELGKLEKMRGALAGNEIFERVYNAAHEEKTRAVQNARQDLAAGVRTVEIVATLKPGKEFMASWDKARNEGRVYNRFNDEFGMTFLTGPKWRI
jgi:DnaJ-class molecular chaperone